VLTRIGYVLLLLLLMDVKISLRLQSYFNDSVTSRDLQTSRLRR